MAVDLFGHPAPWSEIQRLAERHGLRVMDDACEALGAEYRGIKVGRFGDAATFAFYPNKQMTTGEGGMIVTDSDAVADLCRSLRNQGRDDMNAWMGHDRLGYNYRMDEMSAALGDSQLQRIETFVEKRERVARMYHERLQGMEWVRLPVVRPHVRMSWWSYVVTLAEDLDRDAVMEALEAQGVPSRAYFPPVHLHPYMRSRFGYRSGALPITERVAGRTLALPFHNNLTEAQVEQVVAALERAVQPAAHRLVRGDSLPGDWKRPEAPASPQWPEEAAASR
jgi:perosamine synthetase